MKTIIILPVLLNYCNSIQAIMKQIRNNLITELESKLRKAKWNKDNLTVKRKAESPLSKADKNQKMMNRMKNRTKMITKMRNKKNNKNK